MAEKCAELLAQIGLLDDAGAVNERLVRYYVSEQVLTPPEREGREALFGFRQIVELLVTRYLQGDNWPLAKIRDIVRSADIAALQNLIPSDRPQTAAERVVARLRQGRGEAAAEQPGRSGVAGNIPPPLGRSLLPTAPGSSDPAKSPAQPTSQSEPALELAAALTRHRSSLRDHLRSLGNAEGQPQRRRTLRIVLTPWCEVLVDTNQLQRMGEDAPEVLGSALTRALLDERSRRGEKT